MLKSIAKIRSKKENYFDNEKIRENLKTRAIKGASATIISRVINQIIQLASTMVLARILTPKDFGLVAMVTSIFVLFRIVRHFGLYDATIQEEEINYHQISVLFWINVGFGTLLTLVFMSLGTIMAWFYGEKELNAIAIVISLDFFFGGLTAQHRALLQRNLLVYRVAINDIAASFISFSSAVILALYGWGYWALVLRYVIYAVCDTIGSWIICRWIPIFAFQKAKIKHMVKFGIEMIKNLSLNHLSQNIDKILIGWYSGAQSLGFYNRAYYLFMAPAEQLSFPLSSVAISTLSKLRDERERYSRYYTNAISVLTFAGMPISAILTVLGKDLVYMLLGPQWGKTGLIFSIFGIGVAVQILYGTYCWIHVSLGRPDRWFKWNILSFFCIIIAFIIGLPFGAVGVATAYICVIYVLLIPSIWYAGKIINLKMLPLLNMLWKYSASALTSGIICWFIMFYVPHTSKIVLDLNVFFRICLGSVMIAVCYLGFVIVLYRGTAPIRMFISLLNDILERKKTNIQEDLTTL